MANQSSKVIRTSTSTNTSGTHEAKRWADFEDVYLKTLDRYVNGFYVNLEILTSQKDNMLLPSPYEYREAFLRTISPNRSSSGMEISAASLYFLTYGLILSGRISDQLLTHFFNRIYLQSNIDNSKRYFLVAISCLMLANSKSRAAWPNTIQLMAAALPVETSDLNSCFESWHTCQNLAEISISPCTSKYLTEKEIDLRTHSLSGSLDCTIHRMAHAVTLYKLGRLEEYDYVLDILECSPLHIKPFLTCAVKLASSSSSLKTKLNRTEAIIKRRFFATECLHINSIADRYIKSTASNTIYLSAPSQYHSNRTSLFKSYLSTLQCKHTSCYNTRDWGNIRTLKDKKKDGITFISSVYNGAEWLPSFLENMVNTTLFERCELIMVIANSPQKSIEMPIIESFQRVHENIRMLVLDADPGLYNIWNIGVLIASNYYISNANLDDRKSQEFISSHLAAFDANHVNLVSAPCYINNIKYIDMAEYERVVDSNKRLSMYSSPSIYGYPDFFIDFVDKNLSKHVVWRNIPHCMPVWTYELHERYGLFDENIGGPTADMEFWLRCAKHGEMFYNINSPLGLYYYSSVTTYSARAEHTLELIERRHIPTVTENLTCIEQGLT